MDNDVTKTLVTKYDTPSGYVHTINIVNLKDDLSLETVTTQMEKIIESDAVLTAKGEHLTGVNKAYYKIVTIQELQPEDGE